jgi:hypothetical protein
MKLTRIALFSALLAAPAAMPVLAALGGDVTSVQADQAHMKGQLRVSESTGYAVHEITDVHGTQVREFVGSDGKVFAVAWNGPAPDLQQMLGSYFPQYLQAASAVHGNHRHLTIEQPGLVVQSNGRMRAFSGRAWVPFMLPQNFSAAQIQ